jgi:hypothetical protein
MLMALEIIENVKVRVGAGARNVSMYSSQSQTVFN